MSINFNAEPYHDDYSDGKQFYKILFRPGRAVQARELTQLQTALQKQVTRFGKGIYKEGSIVVPGQQQVDIFYKFVKLTSSFNSVQSDDIIPNLVGKEIVGGTTGLRALVLDYSVTLGDDPPTIFVKYLNSGTDNNTSAFAANEILTTDDGTTSVQVTTAAATGTSCAFSIQSGIIFVRGVFAYFDTQSIIVSKYNNVPSASVGFKVTESVVTSDADESLLDPAIGSYNYFGPGADRYKIALDLEVRNLTPAATESADYVELARIENGVLILQKINPEYSILADTLARRTYDESGNYVVRPYNLEVIEHLRTSNTSIRDGLYDAAAGGNSSLYVNVVKPGKSYVLGYELENIKSQYIPSTKARDFVSVNNGTVNTEIGNYVLISGLYSITDLASLDAVQFYNRYITTSGSPNGVNTGSGRVRAIEYYSGSGASTVYKLYLFDIEMVPGYTFEDDVKSVYYNNTGFNDFTCNIFPTFVSLTGTVSTTNGSNVITGSGSRFSSELSANNYISVNGNTIEIAYVVNDYSAYAVSSITGNVTGITASRHDANIALTNRSAYIFELPYEVIKSVDSTQTETTYYTRRVYDRTLSGGNTTITAGTDEVFASYSTDNYIAFNKTTGSKVELAGNVSLGGSPVGKTVTFTLGLGSNDIRVVTTVAKSNTAADRKTKTKVSSSIDFTSNTTATATVLSLDRADVFKVANVMMSANAFGTAFTMSNASNITSRYTFDNGQRKTHYDIATLTLKPGQPVPTGPVRIYFDYFSHSAGDYCTVGSYTDISYEEIPSFTDGTKTYQLRDCIDFRPVIDTNGATFTSPTEFLDQEVYFTTDYEYYLPRTDKLVIDSTGTIKVVKGISSLTPEEPPTPQNAMALYVLKQKPYVFDPKKDISISVVDNRRFTMRDIGRIESRVKNLEYYTTLSLLEKETSLYQLKDDLGFDRFKNGFIVDNFTGHQIGDEKNPDYGIAMDFDKGEIRPLYDVYNLPAIEISSSTSQRLANNYVRTGNIITLPYNREVFVESNVASRTENINPFSVLHYTGTVELDPPSDVWFDTQRLPDLYRNDEGNYNTLLTDAKARGTFGTVWNGWQTLWNGNQRVEERTGVNYSVTERVDTTTNNDVVVSKVVIPKMRSINISFIGKGLKPNTRIHAFFDDFRVTDYCIGKYKQTGTELTGNAFLTGYSINRANLITDSEGVIEGIFTYDASYFNFPTGERVFRLTDSPTDGTDSETQAEARFSASGELRSIRNEIISTRNGQLTSESVFDRREIAEPPYIPPPPTEVLTYVPSQVSDPNSTPPGTGQLRSTDITTSGDAYFTVARNGIVTSSGTITVSVPVAGVVNAQFTRYATGSTVSLSPSSLTLSAGGTGTFNYTVTSYDSTSSQYTYNIAFLADGDGGVYNGITIVQQRDYSESRTQPSASTPTYADLIAGYALGKAPSYELAAYEAGLNLYNNLRSSVNSLNSNDRAVLASYISADGSINPQTLFNGLPAIRSSLSDPDAFDRAASSINQVILIQATGTLGGLAVPAFRDQVSDASAIKQMVVQYGVSDVNKAIEYATLQLTTAILADTALPTGAQYKNDVVGANDNSNSLLGFQFYNVASGSNAARTCWGSDPLAQTFIVVGNPVTLTGLDLFFYSKDSTAPMTVELRRVVNGIPTQTVVPFSRKIVLPDNIETSDNGSIATYVAFDGLVYLEPGEYAVVLLANSTNYRVWISQIGETDAITERTISEQPFIGVLFKSQNASTWTPEQNQDLKFRLYRANFDTSVTGVVDFTVETDAYQYKLLEQDALEAFPASNQLRVYHDNHGFSNGSTVKLTGITAPGIEFAATSGNVFGVNVATLNNVEFSVANVKHGSYTITMPASSNVTAITRGGGGALLARQDVNFDVISPAVSYLEFAGTSVAQRAKLTRSGYSIDSTFTELKKDSATELSSTAVLPSFINITNNLGGLRPFTFRINLESDNEYVSPIVDVQQSSINFIKNLINNPTYSSENLAQDVVTVANSSSVYFTNLSTSTGKISIPDVVDRANVSAIVKGTTITVSNSLVNSGTFRVLDILDSGANIKVFGSITTAAAGNVITITNGKQFIAEEAAFGGSSLSKYITKQFDFVTPSTSFNLRLDISQPDGAQVKIYYKTRGIGETTLLSDKEYIEVTGISIPTAISGEFYEIEKQLDGLTQFESIVFKIVLNSSNSAAVPKCKNLRVIALA